MGIRTRTSGIMTFISSSAGGAVALEPEIDAWVQSVIAAGRTVSANQQTLLNNLCVSGKADGWWSKMDRLWIFAVEAGSDSYGALLDIATTQFATNINAATWTANRGFICDGATSYIDTNFAAPGLYLQDSAHLSFWSLTNDAATNQGWCGNAGSGGGMQTFAGDLYARVNDGGSFEAVTDTRGSFIASRTGAAGRTTYQNGVSMGGVAAASIAVSGVNFSVGAIGGGAPFGVIECAHFSVGSGLTAPLAALYYSRLRTYMTGVGLP